MACGYFSNSFYPKHTGRKANGAARGLEAGLYPSLKISGHVMITQVKLKCKYFSQVFPTWIEDKNPAGDNLEDATV